MTNSITETPQFFYQKEGADCIICKRALSKEDVSLLWRHREYSYSASMYLKPVRGMHKMCLTQLMNDEDIMEDKYDKIMEKIKTEGKLF